MSKISKEKEEKIMANLVAHLFQRSPEALFTADISKLEGRDEEFVKRLLLNLEKKGLVIKVIKNPKGATYLKRQRWRLSNQAFDIYKKRQEAPSAPKTFSFSSESQ